ncbi:ABC transporter ATP-binding protein [Amorphus coralli]|uniref:ABC transporter ATP-binding protein n=1 Tax=Amorphus coralli TaxID=340680 RepID=UPI000363F06A|nr:ABC transporter ATP-binding protein [Amorphus coralli]
MSALLEVADLRVAYGQVEAVQGVSLSVEPGTIATVIGANGAGKTTLLAAIMGLLPAKGGVHFEGEDLAYVPAEERVARGISLVPEQRDLFATMSVQENLELGAFRRGRAEIPQRLEEVYALFPRLKERRRQHAGTLSGGERQMLAMGRALMARPRLLMLDEPSLGLAPLIVRDILKTVSQLRDTGVSILLVEQNARAALAVADTAYVMELGAITLSGPASTIAADPKVSEIYLGGGH